MVTQPSPDRTFADVNADLDRVLVGDLLDSISDPTCEVHLGRTLDSPLCGKPAAWLTTAHPCEHTAYYCAGCGRDARRELARNDAMPACPLHSPLLPITIEWRPL
jgi:hypothetical protein